MTKVIFYLSETEKRINREGRTGQAKKKNEKEFFTTSLDCPRPEYNSE